MKKILVGVILSLLLYSNCFAGLVSRYNTYTNGGEVTAANLNGNFDNILSTLNGGIDNTNVNTTTYRLQEILGSLPTAGIAGRTVFLTTDSTLNFDTGSTWVKAITTSSSAFTLTILDTIYPVGSIYIETTGVNPGTTFGVGTWTAFGAGRVLVGVGTSDAVFAAGATGGESTHTLITAEMPAHTHTAAMNNGGYVDYDDGGGVTVGNATSGSTGGDGAHNNLQPYIVVYMWTRTA
jgi:hypothetical protein